MRLRRGRCVAAVALGLPPPCSSMMCPLRLTQSTRPYITRNAYKIYLSPAPQPGNGACGVDESTRCARPHSAATSSAYRDGYYYPSPAMQANLGARLSGPGGFGRLPPREPKQLQCWGAHRHIPVHTNAHVGTIVCSRTDAANSGTQVYYLTGRTTGQNLVNQLKGHSRGEEPGTGDKVVTNTSWAG